MPRALRAAIASGDYDAQGRRGAPGAANARIDDVALEASDRSASEDGSADLRAGERRGRGRRGPGGRRAGATNAIAAEPPGDPEQPLGDPESVARAICLRLLTQRARSRAELAAALERRGVPGDSATRVLDRFTEVGLIDDLALAESLAGAQHRERGLARRAVAAKLKERGLPADAIDRGLAGIDSASERRRAEQLVARRIAALSGLPVPVQQRRLVGLLARKGYSPSLAYEVVRHAVSVAGVVGSTDDDVDGSRSI